jgi:pyruvate,water dikinase
VSQPRVGQPTADGPVVEPVVEPAVEPTAGAILWLDGGEAPAALGGKAGPLARLAAAGLPVPPGFVITAASFPARPPAPGAAPAELAPALRREVAAGLAEIGRRLGQDAPLVAVRSSATTEDLASASFAGQYETFLGVRGADDVLARAAACWASLWAPHAVAYREHAQRRAGQDLPAPAMAVLVQALVDADAAGVAFTADPITGDRDAVLVNGAWGLGQSVVDGAVEADAWRVDRQTRRLLRQTTGLKTTRTGIGPDAARVAVPPAQQGLPSLTPDLLDRVVDLALQAEATVGAPVDVEWAAAGDRVWLLQARPITTGTVEIAATAGTAAGAEPVAPAASPEPEAPKEPVGPSAAFPFQWPDAAAPGLSWQRQPRPSPLLPLNADAGLAFRRALANAAAVKGDATVERTLLLNGQAYVARVPAPHTEQERRLHKEAFERTASALHERGETYLLAVAFPEIDAANTRLGAVDPATLEPAALADHFEATLRWYERAWTLHWLWGQDGPRERFAKLYAEVSGDQRPEASSELLIHEPNLFTDAVDGLIELAGIVQRDPRLRRRLLDEPPADVLETLRRRPEDDGVDNADGTAALGAALDRLLERQGLRCGAGFGVEHEEMLPSWREDPTLVLAIVRRYVEQDLDAILAARATAVAARDRRVSDVRAAIADEDVRRRFDFLLAAARRAQQGFEDHNYKIDSAATSLLHLAITGCAQRLTEAGALGAPADIWCLQADEVVMALRGLPTPTVPGETAPLPGAPAPAEPQPPHWRLLVSARREQHRWQASLTPPDRVGAPPLLETRPESGPPAPREDAPARPAPPPESLVTGQTGAAGVVTGRVRLFGRETLVPDVEPGDVVVAHNAGPLWATIFPTVAAVVLDEGVFFQHAMLTCREYAVPAIFQTKDATKRLHEGQLVTVDATRGCVLPAGDD